MKRPDITIMTILACEAPKEATDLLVRHGKKKARDYKDLEKKLAELYVESDDKAGLEKELAAIHPHKKWFQRLAEPEEKSIVVEPDPEGVDVKVDPKLIERISLLEQRSDFFGVNKQPDQPKTNEDRVTDKIIVAGMVTIVAIFGMAVITNLRTKV